MQTPKSIKNLTREQLEKLTLELLNIEHKATHRANDLEDIIEEAINFIKSKTFEETDDYYDYYTIGACFQDEDYDKLLEILSKYKGSDE